jgi:hypothetical protein
VLTVWDLQSIKQTNKTNFEFQRNRIKKKINLPRLTSFFFLGSEKGNQKVKPKRTEPETGKLKTKNTNQQPPSLCVISIIGFI